MGVSSFTVSENTITSNTNNGIRIIDSSDCIVTENTLSDNYDGIRVSNSEFVKVAENNITNSTSSGIILPSSSSSAISGNTLTSNQYGIDLYKASEVTVSGNTMVNCRFGFADSSSSSNTISGNTITANEYGIYFWNVSSTTVLGNTIAYNEIGFGIYNSNDSSFYHNNVINNTKQINTTNATNTWDNSAEGNYLSDYDGVDADGDGIGDTPYVIDSNNQDNYPLMILYNASTSSANKSTEDNVSSETTVTDPNLPATESSPEIRTDTASTKTTEAKVKKLIMTTDQQKQQEQQVIPEFPSRIIISLFLVASLAVTIYKKKLN